MQEGSIFSTTCLLASIGARPLGGSIGARPLGGLLVPGLLVGSLGATGSLGARPLGDLLVPGLYSLTAIYWRRIYWCHLLGTAIYWGQASTGDRHLLGRHLLGTGIYWGQVLVFDRLLLSSPIEDWPLRLDPPPVGFYRA